MIFVFGGAHQGMEDYALKISGAQRVHMLDEGGQNLVFSAPVIGGLEKFALGCVRRGESAVDAFAAHADEWRNSVLIGLDLSCGVVPMDAEMRLWRDENGRLNNYIAAQAKHVARMFCGIAQELK